MSNSTPVTIVVSMTIDVYPERNSLQVVESTITGHIKLQPGDDPRRFVDAAKLLLPGQRYMNETTIAST